MKTCETAIIFHCEFSEKRGPALWSHFRSVDREQNQDCHPNLDYPELYLLKGGYSSFYRDFPSSCTGKYTRMDNPYFKKHFKLRSKEVSDDLFTYGRSIKPKRSKGKNSQKMMRMRQKKNLARKLVLF